MNNLKDEIKKILDDLLFTTTLPNISIKLNKEKLNQLKDYITNLQEENGYLRKHQRFHKKFGDDYIFCVEGDKETYKDLLLEKQEELEDYKSRIEKTIEDIEHELSHLKANDEVSWNEEFYTNNKLDYRKLCIALLEHFVNKLKGKE